MLVYSSEGEISSFLAHVSGQTSAMQILIHTQTPKPDIRKPIPPCLNSTFQPAKLSDEEEDL